MARGAHLLQVRRRGVVPPQHHIGDDALDHDDRAVHDDPEVDGAEGHEVARQSERVHQDEREEHREWDGRGHDQPAAEAPQQEQQHEDDEHAALEQVLGDRQDGPIDELGSVVERVDRDPLGQGLLDLQDLGVHLLGDRARVRAQEHHHDPDDRLPATVARDGSLSDHRGELHAPEVLEVDRIAQCVPADDDLLEVLELVDQRLSADEVLLPRVGDVAAAHVAVVLLDGLEDPTQRDSEGLEAIGVDADLVGPQLSAEGVDLDDAGDAPQLVVDVPVEDVAQLHGAVALAAHLKLVDLPEPRGDGAHRGFAVALRDLLARLHQALADELASPVDVSALLEDDGHDRQAELRHRADLLDAGDAAHRGLDREGDEGLHLLRSQTWGIRQHLDLDVGHVGDGVDRETLHRTPTQGDDDQPADEDQQPVVEREVDDSIDHDGRLVAVASAELLGARRGLQQERALDDNLLTGLQP